MKSKTKTPAKGTKTPVNGKKSVSAAKIISEEEYLQQRGFGPLSDYTIDKCKIPRGETTRQKRRSAKQTAAALSEFYDAKKEARQEYRDKVKRGELRPPSVIEKAIETANGAEENAQTQAARRFLSKHGIDWKEAAGKPVKGKKKDMKVARHKPATAAKSSAKKAIRKPARLMRRGKKNLQKKPSESIFAGATEISMTENKIAVTRSTSRSSNGKYSERTTRVYHEKTPATVNAFKKEMSSRGVKKITVKLK